ncbi:MAG: acyl-CoA dehydrogenase family protein [Rhodoferax sp.]|nr:acyl-CoA dehydrogenase family protein [Rhodoferax sp.]
MANHLTPEQQMLQDGVERVVREHGRFEQWRQSTARGEAFDRTVWQQMAELGWLGLGLPEDQGGFGGNPADVALVMEGFGRGLLRQPYVSSCVLALRLLSLSTAPAAAQLREGLIDGTKLATVAVAETQGRFDLGNVQTLATPLGGAYALSGDKCWVPDAPTADWIIVPARLAGREADGIALFLVPADAAGLQRQDLRSPDHQHFSSLRLAQVRLDADALIAAPADGLGALEGAVDHAIVARLAEACGAMDAVSAMTLDYIKTRKQFGTTIGSFQALQHRMVDMMIACEEARSILGPAVQSLGGAATARRRAVSAAKTRVGQCGLFVGHQAVQLHGGIGTSDELAVSHYLKRLLMIDLAFGNSDHHLERFAAAVPA